MTSPNIDQITLKEGSSKNYFASLKMSLGGDVTDNTYVLHKGSTKIKMSLYDSLPGLEILVTEAITSKPLLQNRLPDEDPDLIHFYIIKQGHPIQNVNNQQHLLEAGTPNGVFIYNGLFPVQTEYPAGVQFQFITLKITKKTIEQLLPKYFPTINEMFKENKAVTYHTSLPYEMEQIIDNIFFYENNDDKLSAMIMAKGLEVLSMQVKLIRDMVQKDELFGLHIDDYKRILNVKNLILSSLENTIVVEELASKFGVSLSKLKRDFKSMYNMTVYQFYTHAKMDEAYRRLKSGNFSVTEVGYDLGYSSLSKFSEMFKKIKGISPKEVIPV